MLSYTPTGCFGTSINITLYIGNVNAVVANAGNTVNICQGDSATLNGTATGGHGSYSYSWNTGSTNQSITVTPTVTTTYTVTVQDTCGNNSTAAVTVNINTAVPTVQALGSIKICPGASTNISATVSNGTPAYTYSWSGGAGTLSNATVSPTATTTYTVTVTDKCGKQATSAVTVYVPNPAPLTTVSPDQSLCPGDNAALVTTTNGGIGGYTYTWVVISGSNSLTNTSSASANITNAVSGMNQYRVTITDSCGNQVTQLVNVEVKPGCDIEIPNVFSPDGDNVNQFFAIKNMDQFPGSKLMIFDRWGLLLFESSDYKNDWDGKSKSGKDVPDGTYYYVLNRSDDVQYNGFFMIMRNK